MWIVDVAGLSRIVESQCSVPILRVNDDLERAAGCLIVAAGGGGNRIAIAATWSVTNVELRLEFRLQRRVQRMPNQSMVIGSEFPLLHVSTKTAIEFRNCFSQALA